MITVQTSSAAQVKTQIVEALQPHAQDVFLHWCRDEENLSPSEDPNFEMTLAQALASTNFCLLVDEYLYEAMHGRVQTAITWEEIEALQERVTLLEYLEG
jgi:hypothetical protein